MKRTAAILALTVISSITARAQEPAESVSGIGPVPLCESQALIQTFFNPREFSISKSVSLIDAESGDVVDLREFVILPGRGETVVYQQGRIAVDEDLNEMPDTCSNPKTVVAVVKPKDDGVLFNIRLEDRTRRTSGGSVVLWSNYGASRPPAITEPLFIAPESRVRVRIMNLGSTSTDVTIGIIDALSGLIANAKTVPLGPGPNQGAPGILSYLEFDFEFKEGGPRVVRIESHDSDANRPPSGAGIYPSLFGPVVTSFQMEIPNGNQVGVEQLTLVPETVRFPKIAAPGTTHAGESK